MGFIAIAPSECYQNGRLGHPFRKTGVQPKTRKAKTRHTDRQQRCFKKEPSKNPKQTVQCKENLSKSTVFARSQAPWAHLGCIGKGAKATENRSLDLLGQTGSKAGARFAKKWQQKQANPQVFLANRIGFCKSQATWDLPGPRVWRKKKFLPASPDLV